MLTRLLFYLIFYPLSVLPLFVLYLIALPLYTILRYVLSYRKTIIDNNLLRSFPNLDLKSIRKLRNEFYWHLTQIGVEMMKMISMSRRNVMRRYYCSNPEVVNKFYEEDFPENIIILLAMTSPMVLGRIRLHLRDDICKFFLFLVFRLLLSHIL